MKKIDKRKPIIPLVRGITIDGPKSKDLDDAIWLRDIGGGQYILDICIAHVVDFVPLGKRLFQRAYDRVVTLYHATGNDPMLPRSLSEKQASLLPNAQKKAILFRIPIHKDTLEIGEVIIKEVNFLSNAKLSYDQVEDIMRGEKKADIKLVTMLRKLDTLAQKLLSSRRTAGALAIYDINKGWKTNEEGQLIRITNDQAHRAQIIIQELMILTNQLSAQYLNKRSLPFIVRNHTAKVVEFSMSGVMQEYEHFLCSPAEQAVKLLPAIQTLCNVHMNRATYGVDSVGHIGLALPLYAHFTSPIRRLADLINQYIIVSYLRDEKQLFTKDELVAMSNYMTKRLFEMRDNVAHSYKEKWVKRVSDLVEEKKTIIGMTKNEISGVIKQSLANETMLNQIQDDVIQKLHANALEPMDIYRIVFANPFCDAVVELQKTVFIYIAQRPYIAKSIIEMAQARGVIKQYAIQGTMKTENPIVFVSACTYVYKDQLQSVDTIMSSSKKMGEYIACLAICGHIMQLPIPQVTLAEAQKKHNTQQNVVDQKKLEMPLVANQDYVSTMHLFAQMQGIANPLYTFAPDNSDQGYFTSTVVLSWKGDEYRAQGHGLGKKAAKNLASKSLYNKVKEKF